jgi:hypothetical protein
MSNVFCRDNSELSPDLFFWGHFLRTGDAKAYRLAHDQARHGGDVDSYHLGNFTGLGTRHGVQHWADSAKQARISTPVYRKTFFYISGGDERTGDLVRETQEAAKAFVLVDARRKVRAANVVYNPDPEALYLNFGTDWAGLAQAYLIEWERRGPNWEEAREKLVEAIKTYPKLKNGFVTGEALCGFASFFARGIYANHREQTTPKLAPGRHHPLTLTIQATSPSRTCPASSACLRPLTN